MPKSRAKKRVMYIEQKTDGFRPLDDQGPSMTAEVTFSKTGKTIYCGAKTFHRFNCIFGNHWCEEDDNEYWISGVKKDGRNRRKGNSDKVEKKEDQRRMNGG
jgi:hypothetical protein